MAAHKKGKIDENESLDLNLPFDIFQLFMHNEDGLVEFLLTCFSEVRRWICHSWLKYLISSTKVSFGLNTLFMERIYVARRET